MNVTSHRTLIGIVALALGLAPLGAAVGQDFEAVGKRLRRAVEAGEITRAQAGAMMESLRRSTGDERERKAEAEAEEAQKREFEAHMVEYKRKLQAALEDGVITEAEAKDKFAGYAKEVKAKFAARNKKRTEDERGEELEIEGHYRQMGLGDERFDRIVAALKKGGIHGEQAEKALGGMLRVIHASRTADGEFELDPRLREYFDEIGLSGEQVRLVVGLGRRVAGGLDGARQKLSEDERVAKYRAAQREIRAALEAGKLSREEAEKKLIELRKRLFPR